MHSMLKIRLAILLIAMLAVLVVQPTRADAPLRFTCGGWTVVSSPSPFTESFLSGVAAASPTDVWAVGVGYNKGSSIQTLIEHWNGIRWKLMSQSTRGDLNGVTALSASDAWAVGQEEAFHSATRTLIVHWDGTQWRVIQSPNGKLPVNSLASVAEVSASDIWAVGYTQSSSDVLQQALIEHWNGTKWSIVPAASLGSPYSNLTSVAAVTSTDVWAVGYAIVNNQYTLLTEHWNGSQWSIINAASPGTEHYQAFTGVTSTDANHVWAVGNIGDQARMLIENWNGRNWQLTHTPPNSQFATFNSIAAASTHNVWSMGGLVSTSTIHWDGTKWSFIPSPDGTYSDNVLSGVAVASDGSLWAVGSSGDSSIDVYATLIEHYC